MPTRSRATPDPDAGRDRRRTAVDSRGGREAPARGPADPRIAAFSALQRTAGNRAVARLIAGGGAPPGVATAPLRTVAPPRRRAAPASVQRATAFPVGALHVAFDIDGVPTDRVAVLDLFRELFVPLIASFAAWKDVAANWLAGMSDPQVRWFYSATKVLADVYGTGFVNEFRMMKPLAEATTDPTPDAPEPFGRFVLTRSGWFERELPQTIPALGGEDLSAVTPLYERPVTETGEIPPLDADLFTARLAGDLVALLEAHDPERFASVELPVDPAKGIADVIQSEAVAFFSPHAPSARRSIAVTGFQYSSKIFDVTTQPFSHGLRKGYLGNRAEQLPLLNDAHFSGSRPEDQAAMDQQLEALLTNADVVDLVDRQLAVTARPSHGGSVGLQHTYQRLSDAEDVAKRRAHWNRLRTLCHELMHVMCHPKMEARAEVVSFGQVIKEGFTEVLGVQLFKSILDRARADEDFRARIDGGIDLGPIPPIDSVSENYGDAAQRALQILARAGDDRVRAAYFLGAVDKVGL